MKRNLTLLALMFVFAAPLAAQQTSDQTRKPTTVATLASEPIVVEVPAPGAAPEMKAAAAEDSEKAAKNLPPIEIMHVRPGDKRGLNIFEPPKDDKTPYTGFKLTWGAAFVQRFQGLDHVNKAAPKVVSNVDQNKLIQIGHGFNNEQANLYLNAQIAKGMRVAMTSYLSSRHHNETWVKDGYFLIDASPIDFEPLNQLMKYVTLRAGHFEINYGDEHFRRSDNGNGLFNPFVGNLIMDAFTTEVGGEVYVRAHNFLAMGGITNGEVRGQTTSPGARAPTYLGKLGYDRKVNDDLRVRFTGSMYSTAKSANNTLYSGDRGGSPYFNVLENTAATEAAQAWSGSIQPGFRSEVHAWVVNPFVKYQGLELFGNIERARGRAATEATNRQWSQYAGEALYRFLDDALYVGGRYNRAKGNLFGISNEVSVNRSQLGAGWFITPVVLMKAEFVKQTYNDFPTTDIRSGGQFQGFMIEGAVSF